MSTWSRITVSCLVSSNNQPSAVIARTLYGKSFKFSFSRRHRIRMRVPLHFRDILFPRIVAPLLFLLRFFSIDYLFHSRSNISFFCQIPFKIFNCSFSFLLFLFYAYIFLSFYPLIIHNPAADSCR